MKNEAEDKNIFYIRINIFIIILEIALQIISYTVASSNDIKLGFRVVGRGILGLLIIYNALYLLLTPKWSFLAIGASKKKRTLAGALLLFTGLFGLITALLGYGINGDPRLIWWK